MKHFLFFSGIFVFALGMSTVVMAIFDYVIRRKIVTLLLVLFSVVLESFLFGWLKQLLDAWIFSWLHITVVVITLTDNFLTIFFFVQRKYLKK